VFVFLLRLFRIVARGLGIALVFTQVIEVHAACNAQAQHQTPDKSEVARSGLAAAFGVFVIAGHGIVSA
jgi:choline-glycine betaine transporter